MYGEAESLKAAARFLSPAELEALYTKVKDFGQETDELDVL